MRILLCLGIGLCVAGSGCEPEETTDAGMMPDDAQVDAQVDTGSAPTETYVRWDLAEAPMDFGVIPFPDDLYRNDTGGIELGSFRRGTALPNVMAEVQRDLRTLNGFSPNAAQFFYFPNDSIDPASLPADAMASSDASSTIWMIDVDPTSPQRGERNPFVLNWVGGDGQLAIRPADGFSLHQGRQYAVVLTTGVRDVRGEAIVANPRFAAIRDAASRPADALDARAYDLYDPVFTYLAEQGVERSAIAAMTVFTTMSIGAGMVAGRNAIHALPAPVAQLYSTPQQAIDRPYAPVHVPESNTAAVAETRRTLTSLLGTPTMHIPGIDNEGGVEHDHIGAVVHGHFMAPRFDSNRPHGHGVLQYETADRLAVKMMDVVPFTIVLPNTPGPWPIAIVQHGLGDNRTMMFAFANRLAEQGVASVGINLPFHGLRAVISTDDYQFFTSDSQTRRDWNDGTYATNGTPGADGMGDVTGDDNFLNFLGILDFESGLAPFAGAYVRNALRQSAFDLMSAVRLIRDGDWSVIRTALGMSETEFAFTSAPISFSAFSIGAMVGAIFAAHEPEIGASTMNVTGGHISYLIEQSPYYGDSMLNLILPNYGISLGSIPRPDTLCNYLPEIAVYQTTIDQGDAVNYARALGSRSIDLLYTMADRDTAFARFATESMARLVDAPMVNGTPSVVPLTTATAPVSGNVMVGDQAVTRALFFVPRAEHNFLKYQRYKVEFVEPLMVPNRLRSEPEWIDNPIAESLQLVTDFLISAGTGTAVVSDPFTTGM